MFFCLCQDFSTCGPQRIFWRATALYYWNRVFVCKMILENRVLLPWKRNLEAGLMWKIIRSLHHHCIEPRIYLFFNNRQVQPSHWCIDYSTRCAIKCCCGFFYFCSLHVQQLWHWGSCKVGGPRTLCLLSDTNCLLTSGAAAEERQEVSSKNTIDELSDAITGGKDIGLWSSNVPEKCGNIGWKTKSYF